MNAAGFPSRQVSVARVEESGRGDASRVALQREADGVREFVPV